MSLTIYWILFLVGLGFSVISAVMAGFGDIGGGHDLGGAGGHGADFSGGHDIGLSGGHGVDMGGGHAGDLGAADTFHSGGEIALSPLSPITIAAFIGGFGGGGLIGHYMGLADWAGPWATLLIALPVGFILAFGIYYLMYLINKSNVSSEARAVEAIGVTAEVITPIVEDSTGEIAYNSRGSRYTSPARSLDGKTIAKGRPVKIWRLVGSTCYVKEIPPEEAEQPPEDKVDDSPI